MEKKKKISEEIIIVGSQYGDLSKEIAKLYSQNLRSGKEEIIKALGDDEIYLHPVANIHDDYAVAVYNCNKKRIGYVWMCQAPAMRSWMKMNNQRYVRARVTYVNPVANVLIAETELPFDNPIVARRCLNVNKHWASNLPEVLTDISDQSVSLGLMLLHDELKKATAWNGRLQQRIDDLLTYIPLDLSAYCYHDFLKVFRMMRESTIAEVRMHSDILLNALVYRASESHMEWWTREWLPSFFRKAAGSDLLRLFEAAHYQLQDVEHLLEDAPQKLFFLYKVNLIRFANKLYYSALPQDIYNRLLTLLAVREAMVNEAASPQTANKKSSEDSECFKFKNDFVREKVEAVVKKYYKGSYADLALIEITLFDHGQLKKRNAHTAFVKSLMAWGILDAASGNALKQITDGIRDKHSRLPKEGYKEWDQQFLNDKNTCINIGNELDSMPYNRKKEA